MEAQQRLVQITESAEHIIITTSRLLVRSPFYLLQTARKERWVAVTMETNYNIFQYFRHLHAFVIFPIRHTLFVKTYFTSEDNNNLAVNVKKLLSPKVIYSREKYKKKHTKMYPKNSIIFLYFTLLIWPWIVKRDLTYQI